MSLLLREGRVCVYLGERYQKQSYRNRADILSSGGVTTLSIPVEKYSSPPPLVTDIRLSAHGGWPLTHRRTLMSAYRQSPYYEHYVDAFEAVFMPREGDSLVEYNRRILSFLCSHFDIPLPPHTATLSGEEHFCYGIASRGARELVSLPRYWQVFESRCGFVSGLSSLDLLFCQGPEGRLYLERLAREIDLDGLPFQCDRVGGGRSERSS